MKSFHKEFILHHLPLPRFLHLLLFSFLTWRNRNRCSLPRGSRRRGSLPAPEQRPAAWKGGAPACSPGAGSTGTQEAAQAPHKGPLCLLSRTHTRLHLPGHWLWAHTLSLCFGAQRSALIPCFLSCDSPHIYLHRGVDCVMRLWTLSSATKEDRSRGDLSLSNRSASSQRSESALR